jgi:hypothetical protein
MRNYLWIVGLSLLLNAASGVAPAISSAASEVCGDVNNSGAVTTADALLVLRDAVNQPVFLSCPPLSKPLKTGQTECWVGVNPGPCSAQGQDGKLQLGVTHVLIDRGNGTISDSSTGLLWETLDDNNAGGISIIHDRDTVYTWSGAFQKISDLNSIAYGGYTDWRLPNVREMDSITAWPNHFLGVEEIFKTNCSPGCTVDECSCTGFNSYWTSTTTFFDGDNTAWIIKADTSRVFRVKTETAGVRAVRTFK